MRPLLALALLTTPAAAQSTSTYPSLIYRPTVTTGVAAAGTTLATSTVITSDITEVTSGAAGTGISLIPFVTGQTVQTQSVINSNTNPLLVYPPTASASLRYLFGSSAATPAGTPLSLPAGSSAIFFCTSSTLCYARP